jgi:enoyl-CoA hydratase
MIADFDDLLLDVRAPIATIVINRPEARNACRYQTMVEIGRAVQMLQQEPGIRAIILTASCDKAFSAGADLKELKTRDPAQRDRELVEGFAETLRRIETSEVPVIAAVRGFALGGGMEIAMACHLRIAGQSALFGQPEILRGHIPGAGGTVRFPRLVGTGNALRYLLTGDQIGAEEAWRIGLVNWVVPDDRVLEQAMEIASRIAGLSRTAVALTLQAVVAGRDMPMEQALVFERALCSRMRHVPDYSEGLKAFEEKREPSYNQPVGGKTA